jgi:hypothetical protein
MGAIKKEKYSEERIEKIKKHLIFYQSIGEPIDYEILIDDFKIVRRTNNPAYFDNYKLSLEKDTKEILVRLYTGQSNNCDKVLFLFDTMNQQEKESA